MLTPHCSAASGIVVPPSIVSTTRLRKSAEYGFAIHAGLLPAGSLNHIRAAMGIPDSAFPGNALAGSFCAPFFDRAVALDDARAGDADESARAGILRVRLRTTVSGTKVISIPYALTGQNDRRFITSIGPRMTF